MENGNFVTISMERYEQMIRAEHDANQLKALIEEKNENYGTLDHNEITCLHSIYFGYKEETK